MVITKEHLLGQLKAFQEQREKALIQLASIDGAMQTATHLLARLEAEEAKPALPAKTVADFPRAAVSADDDGADGDTDQAVQR